MTFINLNANTSNYSKVFNVFDTLVNHSSVTNNLNEIDVNTDEYNNISGLGKISYTNNDLNNVHYLIINRPQYSSPSNFNQQNFIKTEINYNDTSKSETFNICNYDACNSYIKSNGSFMRPLGDMMYLQPNSTDEQNNVLDNSLARNISQVNPNVNYSVSLINQAQIFVAMRDTPL